MAEKDAELTLALKQAKSKKMFFAFVPKGADGKLIVSKTKIPPKLIAETKKEIGGGTAITGKCFGDSGAMVFQVAKAAPATLAAALKKVIHRDAGLTMTPDLQLSAEAEVEEEEATAAAGPGVEVIEPAPAEAATGLAEFTTRLKALMPAIQKTQANVDALGAQVKAWASQAGALAGKHDFAQAFALLDKVEAALQGMAAGPAPVATAPAVLQSITISPSNPSLVGGWQRQFKANGTFSDGSTKDVTAAVAWSSSPDNIVGIDNSGRATAQPVSGSAIITAIDPNNPAIRASTTATVTLDPMPTLSADEEANAEVFADMEDALSKKPPDEDTLKKLVDAGGGRVLDLIVKNLPEPPDRATITTAIEARFNIKFKDIDASGDADDVAEGNKSIKQIYLTMLKVPESAVRNNPSLKKIIREPAINYDPQGKNFAFYQNKKVVLPAMRADVPANEIGNTKDRTINGKVIPAQLIDVEDDCKPKGNDKPTFLAWNTLHEVAHGVDDNKKAMAGGGNAKADWEVLALKDVAEALASKLACDVKYIEALLGRADPDHIPPPRWGKKDDAIEWCKAILVENELWEKGAECAKRAIGGRVYHEAYPAGNSPQWVSYDLSARKKGITGYQFRAPGEWFAELYAAYYSGKLKDSHPYIDWIKQF
jgi:hypothetical protein